MVSRPCCVSRLDNSRPNLLYLVHTPPPRHITGPLLGGHPTRLHPPSVHPSHPRHDRGQLGRLGGHLSTPALHPRPPEQRPRSDWRVYNQPGPCLYSLLHGRCLLPAVRPHDDHLRQGVSRRQRSHSSQALQVCLRLWSNIRIRILKFSFVQNTHLMQ